MDSLNTVCLTGTIERDPVTTFEESGTHVTTFTLRVEEQGRDGAVFRTYVVIETYGKTGARAAEFSANDVVAVEGKLKWKSSVDTHGEKKGTLAVLARQVSLLMSAAAAVESRDD
jgi:single-stranded DNA-binding protein